MDLPAVLRLEQQVATLMEMPGWHWYVGMLLEIREALQSEILQGKHDPWGGDLTPRYRAAYGIVEQILAIPPTVAVQRRRLEELSGLTAPDIEM